MARIEERLSMNTTESSKPRAFTASELVQCGACSRLNPPARGSCLYCGAAFERTETNAVVPVVAQAETDAGELFHVVVVGEAESPDEVTHRELASSLSLSPVELSSLLAHLRGAPVLSTKSKEQAEIVAAKLRAGGMDTLVMSDKELSLDVVQTEIATLELNEDSLSGIVRRGERIRASWSDILLIVSGRLYRATTEIEQKRNRNKDVIAERELMSDEAVLDLYISSQNTGWRIRASVFDFSCLDERKKLTAFENFATLSQLFRERATAAVFDDSYLRLRAPLTKLWPVEPRADKKEKRRSAFGDYDSSATITNNEEQFTRYSRLLWFLATRRISDANEA